MSGRNEFRDLAPPEKAHDAIAALDLSGSEVRESAKHLCGLCGI